MRKARFGVSVLPTPSEESQNNDRFRLVDSRNGIHFSMTYHEEFLCIDLSRTMAAILGEDMRLNKLHEVQFLAEQFNSVKCFGETRGLRTGNATRTQVKTLHLLCYLF